MTKSSWVSAVLRVEKPWGHEEHFALVDGRYCGKALHVKSGHALSLQSHQQKEETVAVQSGRLLFEVGDPGAPLDSFELLPGEAVHLRPGTRHRMTALEDTVVLQRVPPSSMTLCASKIATGTIRGNSPTSAGTPRSLLEGAASPVASSNPKTISPVWS